MTFKLGDVVPGALGRRPCWRKIRWPTRAAAEAAMRTLVANGIAKDAERINVYECAYCRQWHVGHKKLYDNTNTRED